MNQVVFLNQKNKWNMGVKMKKTIFDFQVLATPKLAHHRVPRGVLTLKISNTKKEHVFDSRIYVRIMWYTQILPTPLGVIFKKLFLFSFPTM